MKNESSNNVVVDIKDALYVYGDFHG